MIRVENGWCGGEVMKFNAVSWLSEVDLSLVTIAGQGCEVGWPYRTHRNERRQRPVLFPCPRISTSTSVGPLVLVLGTSCQHQNTVEDIQRQHTRPSSMSERSNISLVGTVGVSVGGEKRKNNDNIINISTISSSRIGAHTQ